MSKLSILYPYSLSCHLSKVYATDFLEYAMGNVFYRNIKETSTSLFTCLLTPSRYFRMSSFKLTKSCNWKEERLDEKFENIHKYFAKCCRHFEGSKNLISFSKCHNHFSDQGINWFYFWSKSLKLNELLELLIVQFYERGA